MQPHHPTPSVRRLIVAFACACTLFLVACGGDDEDADARGVTDPTEATPRADGDDPAGSEDEETASDAPATGGSSSGGSGTIVLGDETIEFDEVQCTLDPQEAAAGGGQILFVGQGLGVDADGQDVLLDVSRYDEDSQFAGDVVSVEIGDIMAGDNTSLESRTAAGTVEVEGSTIRAEVTLTDFTESSELSASFEISC